MSSADNENEKLRTALIDMAVESWRMSRLFSRLVGKLDAGEASKHVNHLRFFEKKLFETLGDAGLKLVNVEGHTYDQGMAATALNVADFGPDEQLIVDQMLAPIIMDTEGLRKTGTVMLRRAKK